MQTIALYFLYLIIAGWLMRAVRLLTNYNRRLQLEPVLSAPTAYQNLPKISILVPARNEEKMIAKCLDSLIDQNYPNYQIVVSNDRSTDNTQSIIEKYVEQYPNKVKLVNVPSLPENWAGKNHALHYAVQNIETDWFLFTDADTCHKPGCLMSAFNYATKNGLDMLTLSPQFINVTLFEKMVQPVAGAVLGLWFPWRKINDPNSTEYFANGQFIFIRKKTYDAVGGHKAVQNQLLEDMAIAQKVKARGFKSGIAAGQKIFGVRMYDSVHRFWNGWIRIYTEIVHRNVLSLLLMCLTAFLFSILPFIIFAYVAALLILGVVVDPTLLWTAVITCGVLLAINAKVYHLCASNPLYVILHPVNVLVICSILVDGMRHVLIGKQTVWREVKYTHSREDSSKIINVK